jgi:tetratricopeptide (TPR) repeat protein
MMRKLASFAFVLALCVVPAIASAQEQQPQQPQSSDQLDEAARLTFESARQAFVAGEYERALGLFRQAYQLSNRPGLLYNIAQTLDRLRRDAEALEAFQQFLAAQPDTPNRGEVEARIRVLEQAVQNNRPAVDPVTGTPRQEQGLAILHPAIFISAAALTLGAAAVLIWSGLETLSLKNAYLADNNPATVQASYNAAVGQETITYAFIGVTGGLAALSVVFAVLSDWNAFGGGSASVSAETARIEPHLSIGPNGAFLGMSTSF